MSHSSTPSFASLAGVTPSTVEALKRQGIINAFPIQSAVVTIGIRGRDLLVQSPTGSGKTLAFGIPIIEQLKKDTSHPSALVLVPTRELAVQVCEDLVPIARGRNLRCAAVYGGGSIATQARQVASAAIIVATPGRLDDLIRQRKIDLRRVHMLVLDEADRMLDMGFQPQVDAIVKSMPRTRQTMLFSATLEGAVARAAAAYTNDAEEVHISTAVGAGGAIDHVLLATTGGTKVDTVLDALEAKRDLAVVFVRTKRGADRLNERLRTFGLRSTAIHGGMSQGQRLREYKRFQQGHCDTLVATDVFARGMDCDRITHVINYDLPEDADTYRHRTGRTGRAGRTGTAITMVLPSQRKQVKRMTREAGLADDSLGELRVTPNRNREAVPAAQRMVDEPEPTYASRRGRAKVRDGERSPSGNAWQRNQANAGTVRGQAANTTGPGEGAVLSYDANKGFGFIKPDLGGDDVFFHRSKLTGSDETGLKKGLRVAFATERHQRGVRAADIRVLEGGRRR